MQGWTFLQKDCGIAVRKHFLTEGSHILPHNLILISPFHRSAKNMQKRKRICTTIEWLTLRSLHSIPLSSQQVERWHRNAPVAEKQSHMHLSWPTSEQSSDLYFWGAPLLQCEALEANGAMFTSISHRHSLQFNLYTHNSVKLNYGTNVMIPILYY